MGPLARLRATPSSLALLFWASLPAGWGPVRQLGDLLLAPGVVLASGLLCLVIAHTERSRRPAAAAWSLVGLAHLPLLYVCVQRISGPGSGIDLPPITAVAAALGFHVPILVAVALLLRGLTPRWVLGQWSDGAVIALCTLAGGLAALDAIVPGTWPGGPGNWVTDPQGSGYPGLDLLLLTIVVGLATAARFSLPYLWWIPAGITVMALADVLSAAHDDTTGGIVTRILHGAWLLGPLMIAQAADSRLAALSRGTRAGPWPLGLRETTPHAPHGSPLRTTLLPVVGVLVATALLGAALVSDAVNRPAALTALVCVALGVARMGLSMWQLHGSIDALRFDRTDRVTGLANRQAVSEALSGDLGTIPVPARRAITEGPEQATPPPAPRPREHHPTLRTPPWGTRFPGVPRAEGPRTEVTYVTDGAWITLLLVDLDRFKEVNDALGHDAGDRLLAAVGARLDAVLRSDQLLARLGGDEFAVVLPGVDTTGAERVGAAMRSALGAPFEIDGTRLHVSASIGVATARPPRDDPTDLLRKADVAMYRAKRGGAGLAVYDPLFDHHGPERLRRIDELRSALDQGQLAVHLQPQVNLRGGQIVGAEALARWRHPQDGVLLPEDFLPLAAATGLMRPVARRVLDQALAACLTWWEDGHRVPVSVNLTAEDLAGPSVRQLVDDTLRRYGLPGSALRVEITEEALLTDRARVAELLARWRSDGVAVSIDDYGTGYSSLAYLRELPVDEVKLDQVFTADLARRTTATIVRHTIAMAHGLRMGVVAEGIEDETTARLLTDLGCDTGQGLYFGAAMSRGDFVARLEEGTP